MLFVKTTVLLRPLQSRMTSTTVDASWLGRLTPQKFPDHLGHSKIVLPAIVFLLWQPNTNFLTYAGSAKEVLRYRIMSTDSENITSLYNASGTHLHWCR